MSGAASLFASMARSGPEENLKLVYPVPCPWCLSDETEIVDHEHEIYECTKCGEVFERK